MGKDRMKLGAKDGPMIDFEALGRELNDKEIARHLEMSPVHFVSVLKAIGKAVKGYTGKEAEFAGIQKNIDSMINTFDIKIAAMYIYGAYPSLPLAQQMSATYGLSDNDKADGKKLAGALGALVSSYSHRRMDVF